MKQKSQTGSNGKLKSTLDNSNSITSQKEIPEASRDTLLLLKQREAELTLINSVQQAIGKGKEMGAIYELVGERIRQLFDAQVTIIVSINQKQEREYFEYAYEDGQRLFLPDRKYDELRKKIIREKIPLHINENAAEAMSQINGKPFKPVAGTRMAKSAVYVPMMNADFVIGYVSIQNNDREHAFSNSDVQLLSTLANSMSVALENARLFNEAEQRNAELAVINSVQEGLAAEMDIQGIYDLVGNKIRDLFDSQVTGIYSFDKENGMENFHYLFEDGERLYPESRPLNQFRKWLIKNKSLLLVNEDSDNVIYKVTGEKPVAVPGTRLPKSMLFVPLIVGDDVKGCVSLQNLDKENAFSDSDVQLLNTIANSMSVALENARLFNETEQRNAELAVINSVQQGLVAEMDMQGIYDLVGNKIREIFDAQAVAIATFNIENSTEHFNYLFEDGKRVFPKPRIFDKLRQRLISTKKLLNIEENTEEAYTTITGNAPEAVPGTKFAKSMVFVPLLVGDVVRGYVSLQNVDKENAFSDSDVRLMGMLANSMSVALENARLFSETEQRNAELAVINSVQQGLVAEMDMQGIYDLVGDKIRNLFDAQVTAIVTLNIEEGKENFQYAYEEGERIYPATRDYDNIRRKIISDKKPLLISENAAEVMSEINGKPFKPVPGTRMAKSALYVPLSLGDAVKGYVTLQNNDREHAFNESDVRLLTTLANSMSVALENARLFNETEQRNAELAVINSVQQGLVAEMDMQGIYNLVGDRIRDVFDAQVTGVVTFNHEEKTEFWAYLFEEGNRLYHNPRKYDKIREKIIQEKSILNITEDAAKILSEIKGEAILPVPGTRLAKSALYVPMIVGDVVRGYVTLQNNDRENAFNEADVRLLTTLANSMSVALENARLFNETEQRNAELAVINSVQQGLVAEMDMQGIYNLVGDRIRDLFDAQVTAVATFNYENNTEAFHYLYEDGQNFEMSYRPIDKFRKHLIDSQEVVCINENADEVWTQITGEVPTVVPGTQFTKSALFVPMMVGKEVRGYVSLQNVDKENAFSDSDVRLLGTLVNSMSVALENARLFNETEQRNAELAVINSVQEGLVAEMDMQGIYNLVGDRIRDIFDAQVTVIRTFDLKENLEHFEYAYEKGKRVTVSPRPFIWANKLLIEKKEALLIKENYVLTAKKYGDSEGGVTKGQAPKSAVFVPMIVSGQLVGSVSLQNVDRENAFNESDVQLLTTLTRSMSMALNNAQLFNKTNKLLEETEQRNAELAVINGVQEGLVSELDVQGIYTLVGDRLRELFDAQAVVIASLLPKDKKEIFNYLYESGSRHYPEPRIYNDIRQQLINTKSFICINKDASKSAKVVPGTKEPKSMLFVPLILSDSVEGYISLQNMDRENAFNDSDVQLLTTLTRSMSMALNNARLFNKTIKLLEETEQRNAELAVINSVQEGLVREMDMESIYSLVGKIICDVLNIQTLIIRTFDHKKGIENWEFAIENGEQLYVEPRPFIWANKHLIKSKESLLINKNYIETAKEYGDTRGGVTKGLAPKSAIFVPMMLGGSVIGSVSLQNVMEENAFTESDVRLLNTLTNSMSVALENARLFNETTRLLAETEQRATEMQTVNNISRALVSQLEFDALINLVGEQMRETFKADIVYLAIHDTESDMLHFPYYYGDHAKSKPFGNGITEKIILSKESILINHNLDEVYDKIKADKIGKIVESYLGVPIISGDKSIGVISVQSTEQENRFTDNDLRLLNTIAANIGVAMQNAEAYRKLQAALTDLKSAQEQLVQQEKLASLGQLAAGIAHEIKNPLNFVNNFSELNVELIDEVFVELKHLEKSTVTEQIDDILTDVRSNLKKIHQHGTRADSIVKSMLQHSRGGSGKIEPANLNELIREYVNLSFHGMRAGKKAINVSIDLKLDDGVTDVPLIKEDFSRVILNLCNNAFDAMREKNNSVNEKENFLPKLTVRTYCKNKQVYLEIEDNGPGIPESLKDKILQPFFTTKKGTDGTGLGLSITNDIIKAHGGLLTIDSKSGKNSFTKINVQLPS